MRGAAECLVMGGKRRSAIERHQGEADFQGASEVAVVIGAERAKGLDQGAHAPSADAAFLMLVVATCRMKRSRSGSRPQFAILLFPAAAT